MTMRVRIENDDNYRTLRATPIAAKKGDFVECGFEKPETLTIRPGEFGELWLHIGQVVLLEEVQS